MTILRVYSKFLILLTIALTIFSSKGHAQSIRVSNLLEVFNALSPGYVPDNYSELMAIPAHSFVRREQGFEFFFTTRKLVFQWNEKDKSLTVNGARFTKKIIRNPNKLKQISQRILGHYANSQHPESFVPVRMPAASLQSPFSAFSQLIKSAFLSFVTNSFKQRNTMDPRFVLASNDSDFTDFTGSGEVTSSGYGGSLYNQNSIRSYPGFQSAPAPSPPPSNNLQSQGQSQGSSACGNHYSQHECNFFNQTNRFRQRNGRRPLQHGANCQKAAKFHANSITRTGVFEHNIPGIRGGSFIERIRMFGLSGGGENLHMGARHAEGAVNSLANSPGHRRNMLSSQWRRMGVAKIGNVWVQCFE